MLAREILEHLNQLSDRMFDISLQLEELATRLDKIITEHQRLRDHNSPQLDLTDDQR